MIKTKIAFAQRVKEIKFMEKLVPTDVLWVPLNLETYIYLIDNKKNLLILKNDTLNVIHFNSDINKKDRTKRKFWDLIKVK